MTRYIEIHLVDDIDGTSRADETVTFGIDGVLYQIDVTGPNATKLREAFEPWISLARPLGRTSRSRGRRVGTSRTDPTSTRRNDGPRIRAWARRNGHRVATRGRLSREVVAAYEQPDTHPESA
ncbi:Lsr2 family protein [Nocardia salmonicida]|uniref:histone-like nucleoid-structuring protein Lsr2 n=1 Tax=Nocardia salmonicida TaxID=53431 RepID=UPI0033DF7479